MAYVKVSVPKSGSGAGSPVPKSPNVLFIPVGDIKTFKSPEIGNVEMTAEDIVLNEGAKALAVYMTPSTIKRKDTSDGDEDAVGFTSEFEGEHPGDSVAINNFIEAHINDGFVILSTECATETGHACAGLALQPDANDFRIAGRQGREKSDAEVYAVHERSVQNAPLFGGSA